MAQEVEAKTLRDLLTSYKDMFAWSHHDLIRIASEYGEHPIDLKEDAKPVCHRRYRLNPKYSFKVKDVLDEFLEARFIYPEFNLFSEE